MAKVSRIRQMIASGMSDFEIEMTLDDESCEAADAAISEKEDAGWTIADTAAMNAAWRDVPSYNNAGEPY